MSRFAGVDFVELDSLLSDEERLVRDTIRDWVEERIKPIIDRVLPLSQAREAEKLLEDRAVFGKVILRP